MQKIQLGSGIMSLISVMTNGRWVGGSLGRMSVLLMKPYKSTFLMLELIYDSYMS